MPPVHFTVTQIRSAAACPRIFYFDSVRARARNFKQPAVTRVWKTGKGDEVSACGSLFHAAIEQFNRRAADAPAVRQLLETVRDSTELAQKLLACVYRQHVKLKVLFQKPAAQQQAFMDTLRRYTGELADILAHARTCGKTLEEILDEMFGDKRRRVDATFDVGPAGEAVHVTGILDYVFYDWRTAHHRIIDYKLTPADKPANDLFQVCVYALMHHIQHGTEPDVGVLYLHPSRQMIEKPWDQIHAERHVIFNLLASMREWTRYDERTGQGLKPPGEPVYCDVCRWKDECVRRLGPKQEGQRLTHWSVVRSPGSVVTTNPEQRTADQAVRRSEHPDNAAPITAGPGRMANELWLGQTISDDGRAEAPGFLVRMPRSALPTHVAVVGAAGSGKTWLAKVLAEEVIYQGLPVLAVDPQGDLVQLVKPRVPEEMPAEQRPRYERFWRLAEPRVFTPGSSHGIRLCLNPIRLPSPEELAESLNPPRREEELDSLLSSVAGNLVSLIKAGGEADCQRAFLFQVLRRLVSGTSLGRLSEHRALGLKVVAAAVRRPETVGLEEADHLIKKSEREKLARKLNSLLLGPAANLFTGGQPLDLDTLLRPTQPGRVPLNVIYLNALPDDDQKQFFVATLAAEIYRWMVTTGSQTAGPAILFYLDEARDYLPAGGRKPPAKEPLLRLFAQGRKYGVACLLCTQSPRSVDYQAFGNCSTKLIGRLESAQDVERVAEWFSTEGVVPAWLHSRKGAASGTFVGRWPGMPAELDGQSWKSRCLFSVHEGAWSPERVEQQTRLQR